MTRDINLATWTTHVSLRNESKSELPGGADTLRSLVNAASGQSRRPGGLNLRCLGVPNASYRIQESPDLKFWSDVAQGTVSTIGTFEADVGGGAAQFYRIVSP